MKLTSQGNFTDPTQILVTQQRTLRILIGVLGVLLPLLLFFFLWVATGYAKPLASISHYYFTRVSSLFVIIVSLLAIFLIVYKGRQPVDFILSTLAGIGALTLLLFPTSNIDEASPSHRCAVTTLQGTNPSFRIHLHYTAAAIFLGALALMALFVFTKSQPPPAQPTKQKKIRNAFYYGCGSAMLLAMVVAFLGEQGVLHLPLFGESLTFWMETIAVECFGLAWLIKAEVFFKDKPRQS